MPSATLHHLASRRRRKRWRRPAGACTRRVTALRPVAMNFPTFLTHPEAPPRGFSGFAVRSSTLRR